ncbi:hypothetical protein GCM10009716_18850 [Streptomyces sodiiphilus]|uniref:Uncharacterized protein n=1 Tax=Streptomyces sodiiphilus TaxID=226217 RepID=A0ABP5ACF4_9ACTN
MAAVATATVTAARRERGERTAVMGVPSFLRESCTCFRQTAAGYPGGGRANRPPGRP